MRKSVNSNFYGAYPRKEGPVFYQNELQFLCDTLRKTHLQAIAVAPTELAAAVADLVPKGLPPTFPTAGFPLPIDLEPRTVYKLTDAFDLCYLYFALPEAETPTVLLVGPYLSTPYPSMQRTEEREQPVPLWQRNRAEYYAEIPVLTEGSPLFAMLSAFWERIWRGPSFAIVEIDNRHEPPASPINEPMQNDDFDDVLSNMKAMEKRYAFENEIMHAVSLGQLHKENQLFSPFFKQTFEQRLPDTLRNAKNYGVITNTLLRKAAEKGNVHPVYLDRVSSNFAARIEHMADPSKTLALMREMFRSYCRLVRKHALTSFSPIVQKVILLIDSNLSAPCPSTRWPKTKTSATDTSPPFSKRRPAKRFPSTCGKSAFATPCICLEPRICKFRPLRCIAALWTFNIFRKPLKS